MATGNERIRALASDWGSGKLAFWELLNGVADAIADDGTLTLDGLGADVRERVLADLVETYGPDSENGEARFDIWGGVVNPEYREAARLEREARARERAERVVPRVREWLTRGREEHKRNDRESGANESLPDPIQPLRAFK